MSNNQLTTWSLVLNNIANLPVVNLSGNNAGLANEEAIFLDAPEAAPIKHTMGASNDVIITRDVQSAVRVLHVRVIKGGYAHVILESQANAQQQADPNGGIPLFSGTVTQTTGNGQGGFVSQAFPFSAAAIANYPKQTIRHANAGIEQTILEYEISAVFLFNQLFG